MRALLALLLLAGCGDPLSNRLFEEDALFDAALPQEADVRTAPPPDGGADDARDLGDAALAPPLARLASADANAAALPFAAVLRAVLQNPPTTREEDRRTWGPVDRGEGQARVVVQRETPSTFSVHVDASVGGGPWEILMEGTFDRGGAPQDGDLVLSVYGDVRDGDAAFTVYGDVLGALLGTRGTGLMDVTTHRSGAAHSLRVIREGWARGDAEPRDVDYYYAVGAAGGGTFEHRAEADVVPGDATEFLATRAHWGPRGPGRADFRATGGDLDQPLRGTECWDQALARTFWRLELPEGPTVQGSEDQCPFSREDPRELLGEAP